jgi:tetratricopeptide (TPR) repeat protein
MSGFHTLTVELLAKTAHHAAMSIAGLYEVLKARGFNLNEAPGLGGEKVPTTWHNEKEKQRFFDHLLKVFDISGVTEEELFILVNLSVLPAVYMPMAWVRDWLKLKDNNAVVSLVEKGWLKRDDSQTETQLYLHPVMQEVVKHRARPNAGKCKELILSLARKLSVAPGENPLLKKEYMLYGESVVRALAMEAEETDADLATLANNLSMLHRDMGQPDRALEFQLKDIEISEKILDKNHPDLATSYNNVSSIYKAMGQLDRALEFQLKANDIYEAVLDKNHPSLATSYNNVSLIYKAMGQLDRALEFQLKTVAIFEAVLDKNHPSLATSYNNVSSIHQDMGQLDRALEFQLKTIAIFEAVMDKNHPSIATSYNNISLIYKDLGQLDRALEFQLKDIEISEKILDKNHPDLATSYNNVSSIYQAMGQLDRALEFQLKAVAILQTIFPNGHPNLDIMKENLEILEEVMKRKTV